MKLPKPTDFACPTCQAPRGVLCETAVISHKLSATTHLRLSHQARIDLAVKHKGPNV